MQDEEDVEIEQDDDLQTYLGTTSFGKRTTGADPSKRLEQSRRQVPKHSEASVAGTAAKLTSYDESDSDDKDDDSDDDEDDDDEDEFPVSHEMVLKTHERAVTALTLDPSGGRLVTGSTDCTLKFHDFSSMTPTTIRAFKSVDPSDTKGAANPETHPVHQVQFHPTSANHLLVATALPQAKIMTRDGEVTAEFVKGDMYLRDMHNTKGHISEVTAATWHPTDRNVCVTASTDSTIRIWDINNSRSQREVIVHKSKAAGSGGRSRMTAVAWCSPLHGDNDLLLAAAYDGTLTMWSGKSFSRPSAEIRQAHTPETWTSGLAVSPDGRTVVTRGGDDTIKTWDTRKFKQPIMTVEHKSTSMQYSATNIIFSPSGANILTGSGTGHLHILNPGTLRSELVTPITPNSTLITVQWHEKLNQIITGSANAETHVLYSPSTSTNGAKAVMLRAPKKRHVDDNPNFTTDLSHGVPGDAVIMPGDSVPSTASFASRHPTIGVTASGRSKDPRRPHQPAATPFARNNPDEEYVRQQIPLSSLRDEDPREALLKYADKAKNDPLFTNAWKETQPKTIYADLSDEEEEPDKKKQKH